MDKFTKLSDYISFNMNFKTSINLYLNLNKADKIKSYIPTKSSLRSEERRVGKECYS